VLIWLSCALGALRFTDITVQDFAEQLTQFEFDMFRTIDDSEFNQRVWLKKDPSKAECSLCRMIEHFNKVSIWIASEILQTADMKERANAIKKMINIAEVCNYRTRQECA